MLSFLNKAGQSCLSAHKNTTVANAVKNTGRKRLCITKPSHARQQCLCMGDSYMSPCTYREGTWQGTLRETVRLPFFFKHLLLPPSHECTSFGGGWGRVRKGRSALTALQVHRGRPLHSYTSQSPNPKLPVYSTKKSGLASHISTELSQPGEQSWACVG